MWYETQYKLQVQYQSKCLGFVGYCGNWLNLRFLEDFISRCHIAPDIPAFDSTLPLASAEKWAIYLSANADSCGTLVNAACISSLLKLRPVLTGQHTVAYSSSVSYAGWCTANPDRRMLFWCLQGGCISSVITIFPSWVEQYYCGPCSSLRMWCFHRF